MQSDTYCSEILLNMINGGCGSVKHQLLYAAFHLLRKGRLRGLTVECWITDHYHTCSNLGVGISEGCFIFDFASLPLEVARPI